MEALMVPALIIWLGTGMICAYCTGLSIAISEGKAKVLEKPMDYLAFAVITTISPLIIFWAAFWVVTRGW